jgi:hypothetical protein
MKFYKEVMQEKEVKYHKEVKNPRKVMKNKPRIDKISY